MAAKAQLTLNDKEVIQALKALGRDRSIGSSVLKPAVTAAAKPIWLSARRRLKIVDQTRSTGALQKSLGAVVRVYRRGIRVVGVVGPRSGHKTTRDGRPHNPANVGHLVEGGHGGPRPAPAHPFLEPALNAQLGRVTRILTTKLWDGIKKVAKRRRSK